MQLLAVEVFLCETSLSLLNFRAVVPMDMSVHVCAIEWNAVKQG